MGYRKTATNNTGAFPFHVAVVCAIVESKQRFPTEGLEFVPHKNADIAFKSGWACRMCPCMLL